MIDKVAYQRSFEVLLSDFHTLSQYVEPHAANGNAYSFRIYELILRTCTEFESFCKDVLLDNNYGKRPDQMDVNDYKTLEPELILESASVALTSWKPENDFIKPFARWTAAESPLAWYQNYNVVKHNRNSQFHDANLDNLRYALCGLFCCIEKIGVPIKGAWNMSWVGDSEVEKRYRDVPFAIRRTDAATLASLPKGQGRSSL